MFASVPRVASYQPTVSANAISGHFTHDRPTAQKNLTLIQSGLGVV